MNFNSIYDDINFDVDEEIFTVFKATQGDTKSRGLMVTLIDDKVATPFTDETMRFFALKPDGTKLFVEGVRNGDKFQIDFTNQVFTAPGKLLCALTLYGTNGEKITSRKFKMLVDSSLEDGAIISVNERGSLDRAFEMAEIVMPILEAAVTAEDGRVTAEGLRRSAETKREGFYAGFDTQLSTKADKSDTYTKTEVDTKDAGIIAQLVEHNLDYISQRQQDQLKVATVEKGLNDYKSTLANVNANQEAKQKVTGYGTISLPKNTANGQVSVSVKGSTLKNELNYNRDTWAEWAKPVKVVGDSTGLEWTADGVGYVVASLPTTFKPSTKYGVLYNVVSSTFTGSVGFDQSVFNYPTLSRTIGNNKIILTSNSSIVNNKCALYNHLTTEAAGNKFKLQAIRIFELPTGSEIETDFTNMTADQLAIKYPYIKGDSTKSTISASRLKSVGDNLLEVKQGSVTANGITMEVDSNGTITLNGTCTSGTHFNVRTLKTGTNPASSGLGEVKNNKLQVGKGYRMRLIPISGASSGPNNDRPWAGAYVKTLDATSLGINVFGLQSYSVISKEMGDVSVYVATSSVLTNYKFNLMLNEGDVSLPYEPYTESTQYLPNVGELRSLPNGTKDEIRVSGGVAELVKRVSDNIILDGNLQHSFFIDNTNTYRAQVINWCIDKNILQSTDDAGIAISLDGDYPILQYGADTDARNINFGYSSKNNNLFIRIEKTKIDTMISGGTIEGFKEYLNLYPITLSYQLANEIVTPIQVSGNLISYPSGTVYVENVVADAGNYTTKFDIKELQLPIKSIDKLIKYNFTTGVQTVLDTSLAVINADKKSFTHPNLANKDMVFVDYFYDVESTLGETTIEYLDSRHTIKDTTNNKFYKWNIKSTNGVPTVNLTEVL